MKLLLAFVGYGGNGCPHENLIIKNDKIVFSSGGLGIDTSEVGNGFSLRWNKIYKDANGYMITKFIYEDNKFKALSEQRVLYTEVEN